MTRIELEEASQKKVLSPAHQRGLPLGILDGSGKKVIQPSILRFSPILEWTQRDVWDFILATEVPYCSLYDKGYTAIGMKGETLTNPFLVRDHPTGKNLEPIIQTLQTPGHEHWEWQAFAASLKLYTLKPKP